MVMAIFIMLSNRHNFYPLQTFAVNEYEDEGGI